MEERMKKVLGLVGATLLFAGPGLAADLGRPPVYKAPPMVAPFSWTGCYIGATAGGVRGKSDVSSDATAGPGGFSAAGAAAIDSQTAGSFSSSGFTGGGELGCNYQFNPWLVLGVEGDFEYTGLSDSVSGVVALGRSSATFTESFSSHWLSTVRGRVGIANGQWLFFATGGAAFANPTFSDFISFPPGSFGSSSSFNAASSSGTITGWTAGGGVEWFFMPQWSVKAEYLHVDFGTTSFTSANSAVPTATILHSHTLTEDIGRIGVNFHF
jgi:outer membrane immunogenic protein